MERLLKGIYELGRIAEKTAGPLGGSVLLDKDYGVYNISNDGYEIAKVINPPDAYKAIGMEYLKEAARKTHEKVGSKASFSIILCKNIICDAMKNITAGANPVSINKGIKKAAALAIKQLYQISKKVSGYDELKTLILANIQGEEERQIMSSLIEALKDGQFISIEETQESVSCIERVNGMFIDNGYISPYLSGDGGQSEIILYEPYVLITEKVVSDFNDILPLIEKAHGEGRGLMILAADVCSDALSNLILNAMRNKVKVAAVRAGGYGISGSEILEDAAIICGGRVISADMWQCEGTNINNLGVAERIVIGSDRTNIQAADKVKSTIDCHIKYLNRMIALSEKASDRKHYQNRLSRLGRGRILLKLGAFSDTELKFKRSLYESLLANVKAIAESGYCSGGGVAYVEISRKLKADIAYRGDEKTGADILLKSMSAPAESILKNAGFKPEHILENVKEHKIFDVIDGSYKEPYESGIVDASVALALALENAVSCATMFLSTSEVVVHSRKNLDVKSSSLCEKIGKTAIVLPFAQN